MRRTKTVMMALLAVSAITLAGCRSAPIYNVVEAPITPIEQNRVTMEQVKDSVIRAGSQLGWRMRPVEPGHIVGTLFLRTHVAKVDVLYNTDSYDITYKDSTNLDKKGDRIHSNYNGWVKNLDTAIQNEIAAL